MISLLIRESDLQTQDVITHEDLTIRKERKIVTHFFIPERCAWNIKHSVAEMRTSQPSDEMFWIDVVV